MIKVAINIYPLRSGHKKRGIGYYTNNLLENLKKDNLISVQEFAELSEIKNADIIHYPWFDLYSRTLPVRRLYPTVVTIHDVVPLVFPNNYPVGLKGKYNLFLQKLALKNCKGIITDSENSKKDITKYLKIKDEKISVIPLAVDNNFKRINESQLIHLKRKYNLPDRFILYAGDANWNKNLPFLIMGYKSIMEREEFKDMKLVLIGEVFLKNLDNIDHPELKSLKETLRLIKYNGLDNRVIRPGFVEGDELVSFYNLATVYVQPSLYEGFGLPVLQALSCGTPVVSSNTGSLPEVGDKAVLYFNPADLESFVSIIEGILKDKALRNRLSELGTEQATKFSWKKVINQTKDVYIKAIKNKDD